jgi:Bacterial PH domain
MKFSATANTPLKITTAVVSILLLVSIGLCFYLFVVDKSAISLAIAILLSITYVAAYLYSPQFFVVEKNQLTIKRVFGSVVIPKSAVQSVSIIHRDLIDNSMRTFGVGGLFGYFGKFTNSKLGAMTWYIKRMDQLVLITTSAEKIIVSPDDAAGFAAALT